jgi:hypothetical protein
MQVYEAKEVHSESQANELLRQGGWTVLNVYTKPKQSQNGAADQADVDTVYVMGRTAPNIWERISARTET